MRGDKLVIEEHHRLRSTEISELLLPKLREPFVITVAGESGSGKSELASELADRFTEAGKQTAILQQDDYFVFPPKTNHEMRRSNLNQVGPHEVKLDYLDSNLRSFKRGENPIYKPLVDYEADQITTEELDLSGHSGVIAEGTYTSLLQFVDFRVFIDRNYRQTLPARKARARDKFEPFIEDVLEIEHLIISQHKMTADLIIPSAFDRVVEPE